MKAAILFLPASWDIRGKPMTQAGGSEYPISPCSSAGHCNVGGVLASRETTKGRSRSGLSRWTRPYVKRDFPLVAKILICLAPNGCTALIGRDDIRIKAAGPSRHQAPCPSKLNADKMRVGCFFAAVHMSPPGTMRLKRIDPK